MNYLTIKKIKLEWKTNMQYNIVKDRLFQLIRRFPFLRKPFFFIMDLMFLRQKYIKSMMKNCFLNRNDNLYLYDAGAGFCQYSDFVLSNWKKSIVYALDIKSDYLLDYALYANMNYKNRFSYVVSDLVYHKPRKIFDVIIAIDILEHIEYDKQVLLNFYECLKVGGKLLISTPSDFDETAKFTEEHVRPGYSKQEILNKLAGAGFIIKEFVYSYGKFGKLSWKLSIKIPLTLLSYSKYILLALPIYYISLYPLIYLLMIIDVRRKNKIGNGIVILAEKPIIAS